MWWRIASAVVEVNFLRDPMSKLLIPVGEVAKDKASQKLCPNQERQPDGLKKCFREWNKRGPICVVVDYEFDAKPIFDCIAVHGGQSLPLSSAIFERLYTKFIDLNCGLLVLCVDGIGSWGKIIQRLIIYRKERPHVPIILMSRGFGSDDVTLERLSICDVSIKLPLKNGLVDEYFYLACENNKAWVKRMEQREVLNGTAL